LLLTADLVWVTRPLRAGSGRERPRLPERPLATRAPS
jgi:hypothetical protein